jgi:hypothetical protein
MVRWVVKAAHATVVAAALVASTPTPAVDSQAGPTCTKQVLELLGWRFEPRPDEPGSIHAGIPCDREDLADAHRHGDLRVVLGDDADAMLASLIDHPATHCAYAFKLGDATRRAVDRLVANDGFRFSALQSGWIAFGFGGPAIDGWQPIRSFGRGFIPLAGNYRAIEGFYQGRVRAECGVGRQIAQYAALAELFGPAGFDAVFDREEIVIGTFRQHHTTRSILLGASAGELFGDGLARHASTLGRQGFAGLPGMIVHNFDRSHLDDINNQAQNFVVYEVDAEAAAALRERGGFAWYNRRNHELWQLARALPQRGRRAYQGLLGERDPALRSRHAGQPQLAELDALLSDPFYRGFRIYVHRHGVQTVGWHLIRMLDRNPRTPFRIELLLHNLHGTLFERYLQHQLAACRTGRAARDGEPRSSAVGGLHIPDRRPADFAGIP